jgi:uroporphyrinogen-III synthase
LDAVRAAFNDGVIAACIGPVCARAARDAGIDSPLVPDRWRLGALVHALTRQLETKRRHFRFADADVVLQGAVAVVNDAAVRLSEKERAVLEVLLRRPGATVAKSSLLRDVWGSTGADDHALAVTVARLRSRLGPAGSGIETVVRRGYRVAVER